MGFEEAVDYFSKYGNISTSLEKLIADWPKVRIEQLHTAAVYARDIHHRPEYEINAALLAVIWK